MISGKVSLILTRLILSCLFQSLTLRRVFLKNSVWRTLSRSAETTFFFHLPMVSFLPEIWIRVFLNLRRGFCLFWERSELLLRAGKSPSEKQGVRFHPSFCFWERLGVSLPRVVFGRCQPQFNPKKSTEGKA